MRKTNLLALAVLTCAVAAPGQEGKVRTAATAKPLQFALPAGKHELGELVGLLAQIRKSAIHVDAKELDTAGPEPIVLQREMSLDGDAFDDVVTTLLFYRGLMVVTDGTAAGQQVIAMNDAERLRKFFTKRTAAEVLARPSRIEFVTTTAPPSKLKAAQRLMPVRALFGMYRAPWAMQMALAGDDLQITGSTEQVAFALRMMQLFDDVPPTLPPAIEWPGAAMRAWPGGKMSGERFLQLFVDTLDANVIGSGAGEFDLGDAAQLPAAEWFARATRLLQTFGLVIVPVDPGQRVFLMRQAKEARFQEVVWRSSFESPDEVAKSTAIRPVVVAYTLQHTDTSTMLGHLRGAIGGGCLAVGTISQTRLMVAGLRDEVAGLLERVEKLDVVK